MKNKNTQRNILLILLLTVGYTPPAFSYLDPASGSMLFAALLGAVTTVIFFLKKVYYKAITWIFSLIGKEHKQLHCPNIVFYSEGKQYWNTFKPILEALEDNNLNILYLFSDQQDPGRNYSSPQVTTRYIKPGNRGYTTLNLLEADLCVLTTPGLDVLQIRRSKGVKHYAHIVHAPTTGTYKLYSFDYFDSIFCSGQHQIDAIRELEQKRGTHAKQLLKTGCVYMDDMSNKLDDLNHKQLSPAQVKSTPDKQTTVLVAPSWGENALLNRFGASLIKDLLLNNFAVIVRPHPQSYASEALMLATIKQELEGEALLTWDDSADSFTALSQADIMISDLSGVIFDCAFIFEKPVITINLELDLRGLEANHLENGLWEQGMLGKVGQQINIEDIHTLDVVIQSLLENSNYKENLQKLREKHLFHYKKAGVTAAKQLLTIAEQL